MEKDIVYTGAFNVVKRDFIEKLDHKNDTPSKAFGYGGEPTMESYKQMKKLLSLNSTSEVIEKIMQDAETLNEFIFIFYAYRKMVEREKELMQKMSRHIESLIGHLLNNLDNEDDKH